MAKKGEYRYVGDHADQLGSGRPVEPGEFIELTEEDLRDATNESLAHDGKIIGVNEEGEHQISLAKSRTTRRINKEEEAVEEAQAAVEGEVNKSKEA